MITLPSSMSVFLTIGFAALVTYLLRFGGLMMADRLPHAGRWKRFMDALPGTILLSLIAPTVATSGPGEGLAALATAICAYKTGNTFVAMLLGVGVVAIQRHLH